MIRESLAANSRNAFMLVTPGGTRAFQRRSSTGGSTTRTVGASGTAPVWLRLVRQGSTFTGYQSANGTSWTSTGSATISMTSSVYVGMAVGSRVDSTLATATFTNVQVDSGSVAAPALPAPWADCRYRQPCASGCCVGDRRHVHRRRRWCRYLGHVRSVPVRVSAAAGRRRSHRAGCLAAVCRCVVKGRRHDSRNADGRIASCIHDGLRDTGMGFPAPDRDGRHELSPRRPEPARLRGGCVSSAKGISSARIARPTAPHGRSSAATLLRWRRRSTSASP